MSMNLNPLKNNFGMIFPCTWPSASGNQGVHCRGILRLPGGNQSASQQLCTSTVVGKIVAWLGTSMISRV